MTQVMQLNFYHPQSINEVNKTTERKIAWTECKA